MINQSLSSLVTVSVKDMDLTLNGKTILKKINMSLQAGNITALVGHNGAGKSHLLKCLHGVQSITAGKIERGQDWRQIVMVLQRPALLRRSVKDNMSLGLKVRGIRKEEQKERIMKALKAVELDGFENRLTTQLSIGEQQRVAFAQALALEPAVLLLDEITSALDLDSTGLVEHLICCQAKQGKTVLLATQDMEQVSRIAEKVYVMNNGHLAAPMDTATFMAQNTAIARPSSVHTDTGDISSSTFT